jgi:hypothetical protein
MKNILVISAIVILAACQKIQSYSDVPSIRYKEFNYKDTSLNFTFIDGYGNFGFSVDTAKDTTNSSYNVFAPLEMKHNGVYSPVGKLKDWRYHITGIPLPQGQNKTLKGDIKLRFYYLFDSLNPSLMPDTFRFKFWVTDTLQNKSNMDSTPDLYKVKVGLK